MDAKYNQSAADRANEETMREMRAVLDGKRTGFAALLPFAGPAIVVSVAYMDGRDSDSSTETHRGYFAMIRCTSCTNAIA